jgi:hypothetical protein
MAKASKKSDTKAAGSKAEAKPKAAAKAPTAKAKAPAAKKQASSGAAPQAPMIDTNLAASAAAAMILNRAATSGAAPNASGQPAAKKESSSFKNLKDSLNKPASQSLGGTFGNIAGQKKSNLPLGGGKQVGRNQTFGADVNRAGVPRRTGGG